MEQRIFVRLICVLTLSILPVNMVRAQNLAVKTNLLSDATATLNLGVEAAVAPQWTIDVSGSYNPWDFPNYRKQKLWMIQPEARFYLCEAFNGHFFAAHLLGGEFNMANPFFPFNFYEQLKNNRYEGWMYGAGVGYGYQWILSPRWSIEAEIGAGYVGTKYEEYECVRCGELIEEGISNRFTLTKLLVSIIFMIQ